MSLAIYKDSINPLVNGHTATFFFRGSKPPKLIGDFNDWNIQSGLVLEKVQANLWARTVEFPVDAYMEYAYVVDGERVPDPANHQRRLFNGINDYNHWFYMPEGGPTPYATRRPGSPRGLLTRHSTTAKFVLAGGKRPIRMYERPFYLYEPPVPGPYPLLVVYDGTDFMDRAVLPTLVDNLIADQKIHPVAIAFLQNGASNRFLEYGCNDSTIVYLIDTIIPYARQHLNLLDLESHPSSYGILGASMGGLMALYTALRKPQVFGNALCISGGYDERWIVYDLVRLLPWNALKIWLNVGHFDFLYPENLAMRAHLEAHGYRPLFKTSNGGHNYTTWRDDLPHGLQALFGTED
jgi:enterochelin esterase family protein